MKALVKYLDLVNEKDSWAHRAIFRAMSATSASGKAYEHYKLDKIDPFKDNLEIELHVNGEPANVIAFLDALCAEYDSNVNQKALEIIEKRFANVWSKLETVKDSLQVELKS